MSVMQTAQQQTTQEQTAQPELEQHGAAPQQAAADRDGLTELLAKVPQLSALAATFFAAGPILVDTLTMGGGRHG